MTRGRRRTASLRFSRKAAGPGAAFRARPDIALGSMGIYVFNAELLERLLPRTPRTRDSAHDFGKNIIPDAHRQAAGVRLSVPATSDARPRLLARRGHRGCVLRSEHGTGARHPELNIYDEQWPIWTYQRQHPPAKFVLDDDGRRGMAVNSMVSGGCIISGARVSNSLLFSNVRVDERSIVDGR